MPFVCASLYLATHGQFHNYNFTQTSLGPLAATTEMLKWSCRPSWLFDYWRESMTTPNIVTSQQPSSNGSQSLRTLAHRSCLQLSALGSHLVPSAIRKKRVYRKDKSWMRSKLCLQDLKPLSDPSPATQAGYSYLQLALFSESHLTGFEETSWRNSSSTLLIWMCVLSISCFPLLQNHQNPWILCIYILYSIQVMKSIVKNFSSSSAFSSRKGVKGVGWPHHSVV